MKKNTKAPVLLMILDGYGISHKKEGNAIAKAVTPNLDRLFTRQPNATLKASGEAVGLPKGQMGNSEVGHLNIGAGRIIYQELSRIGKEIEKKSFFENEVLVKAMKKARDNGGAVHIIGLLSDGGVHSHIEHCKALFKMAKSLEVKEAFLHAFLDGRDVPPRCAASYLEDMESFFAKNEYGSTATICGRYYAMDRDNRWERIKEAYCAMTNIDENGGICAPTSLEALEMAYERDENDEFVKPTVIYRNGCIKDGDTVVMFNFRPDRGRELTRAFTDCNFKEFETKELSHITYVTMTQYDSSFENVEVAYPPEAIKNTLGQIIADNNLSQLRIAETEKYAHVTFFLNGGREERYKGEDRILVESPKVATYDLKPEMSANEVADRLLETMENYDLIVLNFANADMVGHTGVMDAAVKAIEALDENIGRIEERILELGGEMLITADHGNADEMEDENGNPITAHSLNEVPVIYVGNRNIQIRRDGILADIAPTILELMDISIPEDMSGRSLILK